MTDISHTSLVVSPLRATDKVPLGRAGFADGAGSAVTASMAQVAEFVFPITTVYASKAGCALDSNLDTGGGTDDTAALQAVLDSAPTKGTLRLVIEKPALITGLRVASNTIIQFHKGAGVFLKSGSHKAMLTNKNPIVSGGTVIDKNIEIIGGYWNGNGANQNDSDGVGSNGSYTNGMNFYGVQNLRMDGVHIHDSRVWGVSFWQSKYVTITNHRHSIVTGSTRISQDGINLRGPCSHFRINGAKLNTYDDAIALNAKDSFGITASYGGPYVGNGGAITDIEISNIWLEDALFGIDLISETSAQSIDRIVINGLHGTCQNHFLAISNYPYAPYPTATAKGYFGTISVSNVTAKADGSPYLGGNDGVWNLFQNIRLQADIDCLEINNLNTRITQDYRPQLHILPSTPSGGYTIKHLKISGLSIFDSALASAVSYPRIRLEGKVDRLTMNDCHWYRGPSTAQGGNFIECQTSSSGVTSSLNMFGCTFNRINDLVTQTAGSLAAASMVGIRMTDCVGSGYMLRSASATLALVKTGCITNGGVVGGANSAGVTVTAG